MCSYFPENNRPTLFHETVSSKWDLSFILRPFCQGQTGDMRIHGHVVQVSVIAHVAYQSMLAVREVFGGQIFNYWPPHVPHLYEIFTCGLCWNIKLVSIFCMQQKTERKCLMSYIKHFPRRTLWSITEFLNEI